MQLEVVVTDAFEATQAQSAGASRIELVANLEAGGTTPDAVVVDAVTRSVAIPVHVMVRLGRNGDSYTEAELDRMCQDAARMRQLGADAIVFGALDKRRHVAVQAVRDILSAARLPVTFHRAFDASANLTGAYATLAGIEGVRRVLTSGSGKTAWEGRVSLQELACGNTVPTVIAAGGIDADNIAGVVQFTGVREVHVGRGARTGRAIDPQKIERLNRLLSDAAVR